MPTANITRSKVLIDLLSSSESDKNSCSFFHEIFDGKSVLGPNGKYYFMFESDLTGDTNKKVLNVLKYESRKLTFLKYGTVQSRFEFALNRWTKCHCHIQGGFIVLDCFTEFLKADISEKYAGIVVRYKLYVSNSLFGIYNLHITFKC